MNEALPIVSRTSAIKAAHNADQIEAAAVVKGSSPLSSGLQDDLIAYDRLWDEYDSAPNQSGSAPWAKDADARETANSEIISEINRRIAILGGNYPFLLTAEDQNLVFCPDRAVSGVYEFCLALVQTRRNLAAMPACLAVREFERLVGVLLRGFMASDCTECYRSGAPADGDRPARITDMLEELHRKTDGEWKFSPSTGPDAQAEQGDDGIDVVVWKRFGHDDRRIGKPFLLAQCACGDDDYWLGKRTELSPEEFEKKWQGTISFAGCLRCLATPRHVPHEGVWREGTAGGGILLDRVRLTWMAEICLSADEKAICHAKLSPHTTTLRQQPPSKVEISAASPSKGKPKRPRPSP